MSKAAKHRKTAVLAVVLGSFVASLFWPAAAPAQGYISGTRHSPVNESGNKSCDYWDEYAQYDPVDHSWRVQHVDGTVVIKSPNQPATIIRPNRNAGAQELDDFYIGRYRFRDDNTGAVLGFELWNLVPPSGATAYGGWVNPDGSRGQITMALFDADQQRILLWWVVPYSQSYGSAVLYTSNDGRHLSGTSMYQGYVTQWNLTLIDN